jgi:ATP-dependent helicase HrpA
VATIDPVWIENSASRCSSATASACTGRNRARSGRHERGTPYGLPVAADWRVHYGPLDPKVARDIPALGAREGEYETHAPFFAHNQRLLQRSSAWSISRAGRTSWSTMN